VSQSVTVVAGVTKAIILSGTDNDNDTLTYIITSNPTHGILGGAAPNLTYLAASNYIGPDSLTFVVNDGTSTSAPATVTINVTEYTLPVAINQLVNAESGIPKAITLSALDADGDSLTYSVVTMPSGNALTGTPPNVVYQALHGWAGTDTFTFKVNDGTNDSNIATVTINVSGDGVNHPPSADPKSVTVEPGGMVQIPLSGSDADNDPLTFVITTPANHGTTNLQGSTVAYTPTPPFSYRGPDYFAYQAFDGETFSASVLVSIDIRPSGANRPPQVYDLNYTVPVSSVTPVDLAGVDWDADPLTYTLITVPVGGTLNGTPPNISYLSSGTFQGVEVFTYKANDGTADSNVGTVTIVVGSGIGPAPAGEDSKKCGSGLMLAMGGFLLLLLRFRR
jgi:hypothetical protein